ncbi:hypothetical protein Y919_11810 [Caloranaerobacter azorensis H53214]|uniref:Nucleotidyltransferase n=1 Tax=Caloranaerobacter azorensis H53214 TaxID=1156417 RepID=A0A096BFG3_9FIRM|nr:DUF86 domain-containing protein [Caloranaerobacter azorensis]KGG79473.1 hypothetical protein Y919_11810 [Caloranaerobacter azorensis H53214]
MKERNYILYLEDILESINKIEDYTKGMSFEDFQKNQMAVDAVVRNLEVIGEAARYVSDEIREQYRNIPWNKMIGLRNILIHEYFGIDLRIVWEIIKKNLPETKPLIKYAIDDLKF